MNVYINPNIFRASVISPSQSNILHTRVHSIPHYVLVFGNVSCCVYAIGTDGNCVFENTAHKNTVVEADDCRCSVCSFSDLCATVLDNSLDSNALILGTRTDIWRVDYIGEGAFRHAVCHAMRSAFGKGRLMIDVIL